jgi:hypothetical protein
MRRAPPTGAPPDRRCQCPEEILARMVWPAGAHHIKIRFTIVRLKTRIVRSLAQREASRKN